MIEEKTPSMKMGIGCTFHLFKQKRGETQKEEVTPEFHNLILDVGLTHVLYWGILHTQEGAARLCSVGSGNTPPDISDVGLANKVATSSAVSIQETNWVDDTHLEYVCKYYFDFGIAEGNLQEIGLQSDPDASNAPMSYLNRQLIRDSSGNPTTVTVSDNEALWVIVKIKIAIDNRLSKTGTEGYPLSYTMNGTDYIIYVGSSSWDGRFFPISINNGTRCLDSGAVVSPGTAIIERKCSTSDPNGKDISYLKLGPLDPNAIIPEAWIFPTIHITNLQEFTFKIKYKLSRL